jgi:truncated hemoglobin YjbI
MKKLSLTALALTNILCLVPACPGDSDDDTSTSMTVGPTSNATDPTTSTTTMTPTTAGPDDTTTGPDDTTSGTTSGTDPSTTTGDPDSLCGRLGGPAGIGQLVDLFLGQVLNDDRINAYFLRSDLDAGALRTCVIDQLGEAVMCEGVVYGCRNMIAAHEGLGISTADFTDFAEDFGKAWDGHKTANAPDLTDADKNGVIMVLAGMASMIVEDMTNDARVYQRVGRKPGIQDLIGGPTVPGSFVANVASDVSIIGFFAMSDLDRLKTCLVRQVHSLDGPPTFGLEVDAPPGIDPGVGAGNPCITDMAALHANLMDPTDMLGIESADFGALVTALINAMNTAGIAMADQNIVLGAFGPMCPMIVTVDPQNCMP